MSKTYISANYSIIKSNILKLLQSGKDLDTHSNDRDIMILIERLLVSPASGTAKSIWPYLEELLKTLLKAFLCVSKPVISSLCKTYEFVGKEFLKYIIQVWGCIIFWFEKINAQFRFWFGKIELQLEPSLEIFVVNPGVN
ncbi:unnamed protein product [Adineta ricciae]|uniref:Uncharacterized protein n=1 Tax=Adineta ricciae TaxID=249248 RepID=A0A815U2Z3_ADIRI|nr:unnamed protein product [Adineta ricciae]CAF1603526.1 unnamed protein product [Adineta ricciae]